MRPGRANCACLHFALAVKIASKAGRWQGPRPCHLRLYLSMYKVSLQISIHRTSRHSLDMHRVFCQGAQSLLVTITATQADTTSFQAMYARALSIEALQQLHRNLARLLVNQMGCQSRGGRERGQRSLPETVGINARAGPKGCGVDRRAGGRAVWNGREETKGLRKEARL